MRLPLVVGLAGVALLVSGGETAALGQETELVRDAIRRRVEVSRAGGPFVALGEAVLTVTATTSLYERRLFEPAWSSGLGASEKARELLRLVEKAPDHGLASGVYHEETLRRLLSRTSVAGPSLLADLDLLATDAFLLFASHLVSGRVDPETLDPEWVAVRREVDVVYALEKFLTEPSPRALFAELEPQHPGYGRLMDALGRYRRLAAAGGWPEVPPGPTLEAGKEASAERLEALRRRLLRTGDLEERSESAVQETGYEGVLQDGVRRFQARHGLEEDTKVGPLTLAALNVTAEQRVRQIEVNLERWRWLPQELGRRYLLVNVPDFRLELVEEGRVTLEMRAIVGRNYRRTPVFSEQLRYLVLNPFWEIPLNLAIQDKLPLIRQNPSYLADQGIRVLRGWGSAQEEVDPATVDWLSLGPGRFPYRLRQDPGPLNALGGIKFMFPNRFNVYLHDTPGRELFFRAERAFSSGCVRIERPIDLAERLLAGTPGWDRRALEAVVGRPPYREQTVVIPEPLPVHLLYWTAWTDEAGIVHLRRDIYDRDDRLAAALELRE